MERLQSPSESITRRLLLKGIAALSVASILGGDKLQEKLETPHFSIVWALGDSYTFGIGTSDPKDQSYAALVNKAVGGKDFANIAVSGDNVEKILKQVDQLSTSAKLVLLTAGGNDIDLVKFGEACINGECSIGSDIYSGAVGVFSSEAYQNSIMNLYTSVLEKCKNSLVVVSGYPKILDPNMLTGALAKIFGNDSIYSELGIDGAKAIAGLVDRINGANEMAVNSVATQFPGRIIYSEPPDISMDKTGLLHLFGINRDEFNGDIGSGSRDTGHPNARGYESMAEAVILSLQLWFRDYKLTHGKTVSFHK